MIEANYTEARANLASLWDRVIEDRETLVIHRRGREDVVMMPASEVAGLLETAHLFRSPANARRLLDAYRESLESDLPVMTVDELRRLVGLDRD